MTDDQVTWNLGVGVTYLVRRIDAHTLSVIVGGPESDAVSIIEFTRDPDTRTPGRWTGNIIKSSTDQWQPLGFDCYTVNVNTVGEILDASCMVLRP